MRRIWLLRHAKSSWEDASLADEDRPLAPRGWRAAAAMATHLAVSDVRPELVLCSSGLRARQTLSAVLPALGDRLEVRVEPELYTFDAGVVLARLRRVDDAFASVMVVGHNPALQDLALRLGGSGSARAQVREKLPTGALVRIDLPAGPWSGLGDGDGSVAELITPRALGPG